MFKFKKALIVKLTLTEIKTTYRKISLRLHIMASMKKVLSVSLLRERGHFTLGNQRITISVS